MVLLANNQPSLVSESELLLPRERKFLERMAAEPSLYVTFAPLGTVFLTRDGFPDQSLPGLEQNKLFKLLKLPSSELVKIFRRERLFNEERWMRFVDVARDGGPDLLAAGRKLARLLDRNVAIYAPSVRSTPLLIQTSMLEGQAVGA